LKTIARTAIAMMAVAAMVTAVAALTTARTMAVAATISTSVTAMVGGTNNNQLKGAAEDTMTAATGNVMEIVTATETATVTAMITMPTPMTAH
jgi:hypothetical protein